MSQINNDNKITKAHDSMNNSMDEGPINDRLNGDNAFSDSGLENIDLLNKAMKKGKSK